MFLMKIELIVQEQIFSCTFRREMPFGNEIYLSKYPGSCSFRIYMVMGVYLQNPRSGCLLFPAPSGGKRPLEMKYTYPNTLSHAVSEYIQLWGLSPKPQEWLLVFSCTFWREMPSGNEIYLSQYPGSCSFRIYRVMGSISKTLEVVACFFRLLQEGDALGNRIYLSKYPGSCSFRIYMVMGVYL